MFALLKSAVCCVVPTMLVLLASAPIGDAADLTMVVCAPGYPGSTAEAQSAMDGFAAAVNTAAGWGDHGFGAEYFETEEGGIARLTAADAGIALVTLPFFLEHRQQLELRPEMLAVPAGRRPEEPWFLVAGKGAVHRPADLDGWQLVSLAGHSKAFVRGPALGDWGELPPTLTISFSGAVLSSLRKAARGDKVVVLLDAEQAGALDRLPFAGDLEVVHQSPPLPVSVVCSVGDRVAPERKAGFLQALAGLAARSDASEALAGVRLQRFEPADAEALQRAEAAFSGAAE
jgi:hypothetical protein